MDMVADNASAPRRLKLLIVGLIQRRFMGENINLILKVENMLSLAGFKKWADLVSICPSFKNPVF
jgi:hypothetical protein